MVNPVPIFLRCFTLLISIQFSMVVTYGQTENRLLGKSYNQQLHSIQLLPYTGVRVFMKSWYSIEESFNVVHADIFSSHSLDSIKVMPVYIQGHWFNQSIYNLNVLHFSDGSTLLGNTQFDCDYFPPGGLVKLKNDGSIDWYRDFIVEKRYFEPGEMTFIDSARIYIKDAYAPENDMIIDRRGNFLSYEVPLFVYDETREIPGGYIARVGNRLQLLDTIFHPTITYDLDFDIVKIIPEGDNKFLIQTQESYYYLDTAGQLYILPIPVNQYYSLWVSEKFYWAVSYSEHSVIQWDTQFMPLDTLALPPGIFPTHGIGDSGEMICIADYLNNIRQSTVVYKGPEENFDFALPLDMGVTSVTIPDTVHAQYTYSPFGGGWTLRYGPIEIEVTNHGADTISNYLIQSDDISQCIWCYSDVSIWQVDTLSIAPGSTEKIVLGGFVTGCLDNVPSTICFSTFSPNGQADGNFLNDNSCGSFTIVTQAEDLRVTHGYRLGPNPANDYVNVFSNSPNAYSVRFYDVYGRQLMERHVNSLNEKINIEQIPPGMYIVLVSENEFVNQSFRLNIFR